MDTKPVLAAQPVEHEPWTPGSRPDGPPGKLSTASIQGCADSSKPTVCTVVSAVPMKQRAAVPVPAPSAPKGGPTSASPPCAGATAASAPQAPEPRTNGPAPESGSASTGPPKPAGTGPWPLIWRSLKDLNALVYLIRHTPENATLVTLAGVAGARWAVSATFPASKAETGLEHCKVHQHTGWFSTPPTSMFARVIHPRMEPTRAFRAPGKALPAPARHLITRLAWHREPEP